MTSNLVRSVCVLIGLAPASLAQWTWQQVATTGPAARIGSAIAYDSARGRTVLFGGQAGSTVFGDTWEWNGSAWNQLLVGGPAARAWHAMAFDILRGKTVLFGGSLGTAASELGDTWEWERGGVVAAAAYGTGCGSPALSLSAVASALPHLNATAQARLGNVPSPLAFVALGVSNTYFFAIPLPVTLASLGMPGCLLQQSSEVLGEAATMTGATTALFSFAIPNNVALVGFHVYLQAYAWAPGANPANIIVSNGLDWNIGYYLGRDVQP